MFCFFRRVFWPFRLPGMIVQFHLTFMGNIIDIIIVKGDCKPTNITGGTYVQMCSIQPFSSQVLEEKVVCTKGLGLQLTSRSAWVTPWGSPVWASSSSDFIETADIEDVLKKGGRRGGSGCQVCKIVG